ncbi:hypothetical protein [Amphritea sp. HPY]
MQDDPHLKNGLNLPRGSINFKAVANGIGYDYLSADEAIGA